MIVILKFDQFLTRLTSYSQHGSDTTLSHQDLRANPNARIHVRQDQVTHMHRCSEYQKHSVKRKESIKQLLHDRMSQLNNRSSS
jgi:hypothetical protein